MTATAVHQAIDAVWRIESARLIAGLARIVRDIGIAEELAQDALVAALEQWPQSGVPNNPGAWLMTAAKHRAIDFLRRGKRVELRHQEIGRDLTAQQERTAAELDAMIDDEIGDDLLRLIFTACHPVLSREARVALTLRMLGGLTIGEIARAFLAGESAIAQRIVRAAQLSPEFGPYASQAAIAACHARAATPADTDWTRIVQLYERLAQLAPSPIVDLNRAVAVGMAFGPQAALAIVDALRSEPLLENYHLLPSVRGDLLSRLGRFDEARREFERAALLTGNTRERDLLLARAATLAT